MAHGQTTELDGVDGIVAVLDRSGMVVALSDAARDLLDDIRGSDDFPALWADVLDHGQPGQARISAAGGRSFWVVLTPSDGTITLVARDVTVADQVTNALISSRTLLRDLLEIASDLAFEMDQDGAFTFVGNKMVAGISTEDWLGRSARSVLWPDGAVPARNPLRARADQIFRAVPVTFADDQRYFDFHVVVRRDEDGEPNGLRVAARDVSEQVARERQTRLTNLRLNFQSEIMQVLTSATCPDSLMNQAARAIMNAVRADAVWILVKRDRDIFPVAVQGAGLDHRLDLESCWLICEDAPCAENPDLQHCQNVFDFEDGDMTRLIMRLGGPAKLNGIVVAARDTRVAPWSPEERNLLGVTADILNEALEKAELIERLQRLSTQDELTGVQNRRAFSEAVDTRLGYLRQLGRRGCLMFIDLDNFKEINDTLGHQAGDDALKLVADQLKELTREGDRVGRYGGDEFVVWFDTIDPEVAVARGRTLISRMPAIREQLGAADLGLSASIGVAVSDPGREETFEMLAERADTALYSVKRTGKGDVVLAA